MIEVGHCAQPSGVVGVATCEKATADTVESICVREISSRFSSLVRPLLGLTGWLA
jgi:hypothetical protein